MALVAVNSSPPSRSYLQKTVTLLDWWLTKPETNGNMHKLGVAGLTSCTKMNQAARCFSSAPIVKIYDLFELETVDGVCVILHGFINKDRTLENGFSSEVFDHFVIGFPPNWKEFSTNRPKRDSAAKCVTRVQEDGKDFTNGDGDLCGKAQNCDSNTVDMRGQDCKDTMLSNKTITPPNPPSVEIPDDHIIEAGNEVLCERSPAAAGFEVDLGLEMSPIVSNIVDSSAGSKCSGVSIRCMTRSMKKLDNIKNSFSLVNDISNLDKGTLIHPGIIGSSESLRKDINDIFSNNKKAADFVDCDMKSTRRNTISKSSGGCGKRSNKTTGCSEDTVLRMQSKQKQFGQNVDVGITKDIRNGISNQEKNKDDAEVNGNIVGTRRSMKGCGNKKENKVKVPNKEGVPATHRINSKETCMTQNKSKTKLPVKRKLITSPKSAKSTTKKGSEERYGSAKILSLESFSGKKSRSGRVVLPPLEFWRNQKVVYDEAGQMRGVQEPK